MDALKSWQASGWSWLTLGALWLVVCLLGLTNGNASSSVWMLPVAILFLILGTTRMTRGKRRNSG